MLNKPLKKHSGEWVIQASSADPVKTQIFRGLAPISSQSALRGKRQQQREAPAAAAGRARPRHSRLLLDWFRLLGPPEKKKHGIGFSSPVRSASRLFGPWFCEGLSLSLFQSGGDIPVQLEFLLPIGDLCDVGTAFDEY